MNSMGIAEIVILVIIGVFFMFFRKKTGIEQSGLLTPFEFSNTSTYDNSMESLSFSNPLNIMFVLLIIEGLFYKIVPKFLDSYRAAGDFETGNNIYTVSGLVFTLLFSIVSLKITNKLLRIIVLLYFAYSIFTSISQLLNGL